MNIEPLPLVSIAIITYNQREFLRECIESCLEQDYQNIEIVIADDGSTDGTHDMLNAYNEKYPGKFVLRLSRENQGITKNSNLAHFACSGKYIAWMGGDDLMLPGKISTQVKFMEKNPTCAICYHDLVVFDSKTGCKTYLFSEKNKPREGGVADITKYGCFNGACATFIRKNKAPKNGFNELLPVASDWLYWIECLATGGEIRYINSILGKYRRHDLNVTKKHVNITQNYIDHLNTCNHILVFAPHLLKETNHARARIIASIRKQLNYRNSLIISLRNRFSFKIFSALICNIITLDRIKF